ncbi:MAG TPA: hypothetical protein VFR58_13975 [Flavisolibacter sp.]|nr:hypothetical protein [Flavisolibacter sp.]
MTNNHFISLDEAIAMTTRYRADKASILSEPYKKTGILPVCETFDRAAIEILLSHRACTGMRIYMAMDEREVVKMVLVGVDAEGNDILPQEQTGTMKYMEETGGAVILENGIRCPDHCPPSSPLN